MSIPAERKFEQQDAPARDASATRPRDRIVAAASDLFHRHGVRGIGVDAIAAAAGTNKMTLYRHFASKDDLICECLARKAHEADKVWDGLEATHPDDARAQLHAWVAHVARKATAGQRDCALANAAVELTEPDHPARQVVEAFKTAYHDRLARLCRAAGVVRADALADALLLLLEGARVSVQSVGVEGPAGRFVSMCEALIASFDRSGLA